jgi:hypothetical protein
MNKYTHQIIAGEKLLEIKTGRFLSVRYRLLALTAFFPFFLSSSPLPTAYTTHTQQTPLDASDLGIITAIINSPKSYRSNTSIVLHY